MSGLDPHSIALIVAGAIGAVTAIVHGVLIQRMMVRPIGLLLADSRMPAPLRKLVAPLLHLSTLVWFVGGAALIAVAFCNDAGARLATGLLVGGTFAFGAIFNAWATRGKHPGWMLMAVAVALIAYGLT